MAIASAGSAGMLTGRRQSAFSFRPDGDAAALLDADVRRNYAGSFARLRDAVAAQRPDDRIVFERHIAALDRGPVPPGVFALYSDLVTAIYRDDDAAFGSCLQGLADCPVDVPTGVCRPVTLVDALLGSGMARRYIDHVLDDPSQSFTLSAVQADALQRASECLTDALSLLAAADPEHAAEIGHLVREVVFVSSDMTGARRFGGASSFYLWGALFLNAEVHPDRVAMVDGLVHEAAHSLLLGHTLGASMVVNDPADRFPSPLRADARPMDGVVHATFVLARMHYGLGRLGDLPLITDRERARIGEMRAESARACAAGLEVILRDARFTDIGAAVFRPARDYMREADIG